MIKTLKTISISQVTAKDIRENEDCCGYLTISEDVICKIQNEEVTITLVYCSMCKKYYVNPSFQGTLQLEPAVKDDSFSWPSTYARETNGVSKVKMNFKPVSNLYELGYNVSKKNRLERWDVLERIVLKQLTLKEVAYTIASHVRSRKAQRGGQIKYIHAIAQWERDLSELKNKYYKGSFVWPSH